MLSDKVYGFVIGSVMADILSYIVKVNNIKNIMDVIQSPEQASEVGLDEGIWTDPTAMLLKYISNINYSGEEKKKAQYNLEKYKIGTCDNVFYGKISDYHESLYLASLRFYYCAEFNHCLKYFKMETDDPYSLLWLCIIDLAIHDINKSKMLDPKNYLNFIDDPEILGVFQKYKKSDLEPLNHSNSIFDIMRCVLHVFRHTDNYVDGLVYIANYCNKPQITSFFYGQLAGSYYGVTDIPKEWIQLIKNKKFINLTIDTLIRSPLVSLFIDKEKE
jgi:hypothetical protein